jgi:hypothetical protein
MNAEKAKKALRKDEQPPQPFQRDWYVFPHRSVDFRFGFPLEPRLGKKNACHSEVANARRPVGWRLGHRTATPDK